MTAKERFGLLSTKLFSTMVKNAFFLNITNLSKDRKITITNIWFDSKPQIGVFQKDRKLPVSLELDEPWETWIETKYLPQSIIDNPFNSARLRLSNGKIFKSKENIGVPLEGFIPGGKITEH